MTIETAGTVERPVHADLMSISPKRANSTPTHAVWADRHEQLRDRAEIVARMTRDYRYQLKYVIDHPEDVDDVDRHVAGSAELRRTASFSCRKGPTPTSCEKRRAGCDPAARTAGYSVSPRLHIELFGNRRGT